MCNASAVGDHPSADHPLEMLIGAIERFVQVPVLELTPTELGDHLVRLRHGIDVLELGFATGAASFAATDEYDAQGSVTPIDWIRHHCHMSSHAAARAVAAGEQIGRLPASVAALDAGDIGFAHFSLLAGVARALSAKPGAGGLHAAVPGYSSGDGGSDPADPSVAADPSVPADPSVTATSVNPLRFDEGPSWNWPGSTRSAASATTAPMPVTPLTPPQSSRSR
jgi:hypothetical protein